MYYDDFSIEGYMFPVTQMFLSKWKVSPSDDLCKLNLVTQIQFVWNLRLFPENLLPRNACWNKKYYKWGISGRFFPYKDNL